MARETGAKVSPGSGRPARRRRTPWTGRRPRPGPGLQPARRERHPHGGRGGDRYPGRRRSNDEDQGDQAIEGAGCAVVSSNHGKRGSPARPADRDRHAAPPAQGSSQFGQPERIPAAARGQAGRARPWRDLRGPGDDVEEATSSLERPAAGRQAHQPGGLGCCSSTSARRSPRRSRCRSCPVARPSAHVGRERGGHRGVRGRHVRLAGQVDAATAAVRRPSRSR